MISRNDDGSWDVTLTPTELRMAAVVGVEWLITTLDRPDRVPLRDDDAGWNKNLNGAAGELAYAKFRDIWWNPGVGRFTDSPDVGSADVRTRTRHDWDLLVRTHDKEDRFYVHVTGRPPTYRIHGWIQGTDAKLPQFLSDPGGYGRPAYFVPAHYLTRFVAPGH